MTLRVPYEPFISLATDISSNFRRIHDEDAVKNVYKVLLLHFFNKSWRTFESVHLLCEKRFAQEASILLRSFLELVVSAVYISKDPSRAILFAEYGYLEKMSFRRALEEYQVKTPMMRGLKAY